MEYVEQRQVTLRVNGESIIGQIQGSLINTIFKSQQPSFVIHFPSGEFESIELEKENCTEQQWEIINTAKEKVKSILENG